MRCVFPQARQIPVTTDDSEVKAQLREFGEPICKLSFLVFLYKIEGSRASTGLCVDVSS